MSKCYNVCVSVCVSVCLFVPHPLYVQDEDEDEDVEIVKYFETICLFCS